jgi:hypothetical protein
MNRFSWLLERGYQVIIALTEASLAASHMT